MLLFKRDKKIKISEGLVIINIIVAVVSTFITATLAIISLLNNFKK